MRPSDLTAGLRKALCQAWKERRHGCGGDLRGGEPAEHAVCPVKSADQQAVLMLHRTRALLIRQQTMLANAFRAHLAEFRIVVAQAMWFDASRSVGCCYEAQFTLLRRDLSQCRRRQVLTQEKGFRGMLGCDAWYTFTVN